MIRELASHRRLPVGGAAKTERRALPPSALVACAGLATTLASACGSPPPPRDAKMSYPCILHAPIELSPDIVVEQHVVARHGEHEGAFDAVVQKRGAELLVVGLGPLNTRAFVLRQEGDGVRFEQRMGPALPFPPRNVLVDVHRAFFKRLPTAGPDGVFGGAIDDEVVTETWRGGELVERRFARADRPGRAVRVIYGPGCRSDACEPATMRVINEWFGYELAIENRRFTRLPP